MNKSVTIICILMLALCACEGKKEHLAETPTGKDSLLFMHSTGVSTLISDSGVVRYKVIAEDYDIYNDSTPGNKSTWVFPKGAFLQRYDKNMNVDLYAQADTVYYHEQYLWEMRGRVVINNSNGTIIKSEELFYNEHDHYMWSDKFTRIEQPDREIEGYSFRSNDKMTDYRITNTRGSFERKPEKEKKEAGQQPNEVESPNNLDAVQTDSVAPSAPGKLEAEMRRRGRLK